jgi:hypothetical protein
MLGSRGGFSGCSTGAGYAINAHALYAYVQYCHKRMQFKIMDVNKCSFFTDC